ncbi:hypothetical protein HUK80_02075 [Flavobacterium sp. MAH-1]|uniref:Uncharacterized protein n=1 Tax=Flavobacterium agri TaxID=2743471 RepID=A0A7Y9C5T0_9FLAO|nr:hypothetical protein [Flavobacterium agri]NUY79668.1 hypothetical protein [Flavobacterium agri]NYA69693.1 hypothetical protein [Flavobacterium agri]
MNGLTELLAFGLLYLFVVLVIFLLLREFNCWYWKINRRISVQERTNELLVKLLSEIQTAPKEENPKNELPSTAKISLNEMYRRKRENGDLPLNP